MQILTQLGANYTAFIQFALFIISISFLTIYVYGPFFKALDERQKQTKGAEQVASETEEEAKKVESIFKLKAREINDKIKNIFDASKKQASEKTEELLNSAKGAVAQTTEAARKQIETQKANAQKEISSISEEVANEITKKISGAV